MVEGTRRRNFAAAAVLLALIVAASATLIQASRRAQRLAELQMNFVAGVSHELRTPLSVIRTAAYNLRGRVSKQPEQVERYGQLIQSEAEKLGDMVEQVLRFASGEAGKLIQDPQPCSAEAIVERALEAMRPELERREIHIEKTIASALPPVIADAAALQHAVRNLIENAIKYGTARENWIGVSIEPARNAVEIAVRDHGPGIPGDDLRRIFDPFFRGRDPVSQQIHGTGLGLSLVKKIVEAHRGTIDVRSNPDSGTEFVLRIPTAPLNEEHELAHSVS